MIDEVNRVKDLSETSRANAAAAQHYLDSATKASENAQKAYSESIKTTADSSNKLFQLYSDRAKEIEDTLNSVQNAGATADNATKAANGAVAAANKALTTANKALAALQPEAMDRLRSDLSLARIYKPFIIRDKVPESFELPAPDDPNHSSDPRYRITVLGRHVGGDLLSLTIWVKDLITNSETQEPPTRPLKDTDVVTIDTAPGLFIQVDSTKHQTISHSFALMHIAARMPQAAVTPAADSTH